MTKNDNRGVKHHIGLVNGCPYELMAAATHRAALQGRRMVVFVTDDGRVYAHHVGAKASMHAMLERPETVVGSFLATEYHTAVARYKLWMNRKGLAPDAVIEPPAPEPVDPDEVRRAEAAAQWSRTVRNRMLLARREAIYAGAPA